MNVYSDDRLLIAVVDSEGNKKNSRPIIFFSSIGIYFHLRQGKREQEMILFGIELFIGQC